MTSSSRNRRSLTTVNTSTNRLRRSARAELSSAAGRSNLFPTSLAAPSTSRARVDEMTWVKMFSDIHSGRVLHRTRLRGYRAKGSAIATTAATAPARQRCERGRGGGGFIVTLAFSRGGNPVTKKVWSKRFCARCAKYLRAARMLQRRCAHIACAS